MSNSQWNRSQWNEGNISFDPGSHPAIKALSEAWADGEEATHRHETALRDQLGPDYTGRALAATVLALPILGQDADRHAAEEQKERLLGEVEHRVLNPVMLEMENAVFCYVNGNTQDLAGDRRFLMAAAEFLVPFHGATGDRNTDENISDTCNAARLVYEYEPPYAGFVKGPLSNSRISKLFKKAGEGKASTAWAADYVVLSAMQLERYAARADVLARALYLSHPNNPKSPSSIGMHAAIWGEVADRVEDDADFQSAPGSSLSEIMHAKLGKLTAKAPANSALKKLAGDFSEKAQRWEEEARREEEQEPSVRLEETLLLEPTSIARRLEAGEPIGAHELEFDFFEGQETHRLINAARVLASVDVLDRNAQAARKQLVEGLLDCIDPALVDAARGTKSLSDALGDTSETMNRLVDHVELEHAVERIAEGDIDEPFTLFWACPGICTPYAATAALTTIEQRDYDAHSKMVVQTLTTIILSSTAYEGVKKQALQDLYDACIEDDNYHELAELIAIMASTKGVQLEREVQADEEAEPVTFDEVLNSLRENRVSRGFVFEEGQPEYVIMATSLALAKVPTVLKPMRKNLVVSVLSSLSQEQLGEAGVDLVNVLSEDEQIVECVEKIRDTPLVKAAVLDSGAALLAGTEALPSDKLHIVNNLLSWYGDEALPAISEATTSLIRDSTVDTYPQQTVRYVVSRLMGSATEASSPASTALGNILRALEGNAGIDDELHQTINEHMETLMGRPTHDRMDALEQRIADAEEDAEVISVLDELGGMWEEAEKNIDDASRAQELIGQCQDRLNASDSGRAEHMALLLSGTIKRGTGDQRVITHAVLTLRQEHLAKIEDYHSVTNILEAVKIQQEASAGPSNFGDQLILLRQACEERRAQLATIDQLTLLLDNSSPDQASQVLSAFREVVRRSESEGFTQDDAQAVLNRLERPILVRTASAGSNRTLTDENIEALRTRCNEKLEAEQGPPQIEQLDISGPEAVSRIVEILESGDIPERIDIVFDSPQEDHERLNTAKRISEARVPPSNLGAELFQKNVLQGTLQNLDIGLLDAVVRTGHLTDALVDAGAIYGLIRTLRLQEASYRLGNQASEEAMSVLQEYGPEVALPYVVPAAIAIAAHRTEAECSSVFGDAVEFVLRIEDKGRRDDAIRSILDALPIEDYPEFTSILQDGLMIGVEEPVQQDAEAAPQEEAEAPPQETPAEEEQEGPQEEPEFGDILPYPREPTIPGTSEMPEGEPAAIFSKLEEAMPVLERLATTTEAAEAKEAYHELASLLAEIEDAELPHEEMAMELADLVLNGEEGDANLAASAMLSFPVILEGRVPMALSSMITTNLADAVQSASNPALTEKLLYGTPMEADWAIEVLAEKTRKFGVLSRDTRGRTRPTHELAVEQAVTNSRPPAAARMLIALSERGVSDRLLLDSLSILHTRQPAPVAEVVLDVLLNHRESLFDETTLFFGSAEAEAPMDAEATLAEDFLAELGGDIPNREESVAAAVSGMQGETAIEFALQRMNDAEEEDVSFWASALEAFEGEEADEMIMDAFDSLMDEVQPHAIHVLFNRSHSLEKAEFLFQHCDSENGEIADEARYALNGMGFSGEDAERELALLCSMRTHKHELLRDAAGQKLAHFLGENKSGLSAESLSKLSSLYVSDSDPEIQTRARESLLTNLDEMEEEERDRIASEDIEVSTYVVASEMRADRTEFGEETKTSTLVHETMVKMQQDGNDEGCIRMMFATYTSRNPKYYEQVLVPYLGEEDSLSNRASQWLRLLGEEGLDVATRAAMGRNHPDGITREMAARISDKALAVLCEVESYEKIVGLLTHNDNAVRARAINTLRASPDGAKKVDALLEATSSENADARRAALNLLPRSEEHLGVFLGRVGDESEKVSAFAADIAAPLLTPETLTVFLNSSEYDDVVKQQVADAVYASNPAMVGILGKRMAEEPQLRDKVAFVSALRFFPCEETLKHFAEFQEEVGRSASLMEAMDYLCNYIAGSKPSSGIVLSEENARLLLAAYNQFDFDAVKQVLMDVAGNRDAETLHQAALESGNQEILYAASKVFLSVNDQEHAIEAALAYRKLEGKADIRLTEPHEQILFGEGDLSLLESPIQNPAAPPLPYGMVKEVVMEELLNGGGSMQSYNRFIEFGREFGDLDDFFEYGLRAVSELIWGFRNEDEYRQLTGDLRVYVDESLVDDTDMLVDILVSGKLASGKRDLLGELVSNPELAEIVSEHALRRAVEAVECVAADNNKAVERLMLLAELVERETLSVEDFLALADPQHPTVSAVGSGNLAWELAFNDAKDAFEDAAAVAQTKREMRERRQGVSSRQAREDAAKIERQKPIQPVKPTSSPPRRPSRGPMGGNGQK